jgi:hypothetical protein
MLCHGVEFGRGTEGSKLDDFNVVSFSDFVGDFVEVVGVGVDLVDADAVKYDAEFGLPYYKSFKRFGPVNLSQAGCLFCRFACESNIVAL